jgi:hypothetical protein
MISIVSRFLRRFAILKQRRYLPLIAIIFLGFILRFWGIGFGFPYTYHVDEPAYISAALNLGAGIIGRQPNPTGFSNILLGEFGIFFVIGILGGLFDSVNDFATLYRADPTVFFLLGRITIAFFGGLTVVGVYGIGKILGGYRNGLIAAFLLAIAYLHARDSHYAVPDIGFTFFMVMSTLLAIVAIRKSQERYLVFASLVGGYGIATKWTGLPIIVTLFLAGIIFYGSNPPAVRGYPRLTRNIIWMLGLSAGFFLGGFQILLQPVTFFEYAMREAQSGEGGGFGHWQIDSLPGWIFYIKTLGLGLGIILVTLGFLGLLLYVRQCYISKNHSSWIVLSFPLIYFLVMGGTRHYFARYALPLIPFIIIFAGFAIHNLLLWLETKKVQRLWVWGGLILVLASAQPLSYLVQHNVLLTRPDTRTVAKDWIEGNIPSGAKIALDWPIHAPTLSSDEKKLADSKAIYDLTYVGETGLSEHSTQWYRDQQFDYLITSSFVTEIPLSIPEYHAKRVEFYASLDREFGLYKTFSPTSADTPPSFVFDEIYGPFVSVWERDYPGPIIKIYRVP